MATALPDPASAPALFENLLLRRVVAFCIDSVALIAIAMALIIVGLISGFVTLGIGWVLLPVVLPLALLSYYPLTLGSPARATLGMSMMDLVLTPARGQPLNGVFILFHPLVFWLSFWISWPVSLLFALFTPRRQMLHDLITGTLMLRRSPMERHWRGVAAAGGG